MKFALSAISNIHDGMSVHHASIAKILNQLGEVTLISDSVPVSSHELNQYDFVFRYGWPEVLSKGYRDADFNCNISEDTSKNVLIAPFCMSMLNEKAIKQIEMRFSRIIYDSSVSREHGSDLLQSVRSTFIHSIINENPDASPPEAIEPNIPYTFLHISNGLYWIKGVDIAIDAFLRRFSASDNVRLHLVIKNQGGMFNKIRAQFNQQDRLHQIWLSENNLSKEEIARLFRQADCYVCVSRYDTFSLPTLEAAVYGLQIIAHEKCGVRDYAYGFNNDQYMPVSVQRIVIPEGAWRENSQITSWEPILSSVEQALGAANEKGRRNKQTNHLLLRDFGSEERGLSAMKVILQ